MASSHSPTERKAVKSAAIKPTFSGLFLLRTDSDSQENHKPTFSVLMATDMSRFPGSLSRPLHTSPNSPVVGTNAGL
ncbi:hypothetical protein EYF80_020626 [Liparis tanakae]|uniref:Uncharacterized protein n=1 Tax=Liparis tanakae TaxID=230148 RepID=A0A4Z2HTL7_9TELE|nr:hypothetical protein EYF80_020626 [Liparis tanakae]